MGGCVGIKKYSDPTFPPKTTNRRHYFEIILTPMPSPNSKTPSRADFLSKDHTKDRTEVDPASVPPVAGNVPTQQLEGREGDLDCPTCRKAVGLEHFEVTHLIGRGSYGRVFLGWLRERQCDGGRLAIKQMLKTEVHRKKLEANVRLEKAILRDSQSAFITRLVFAFRDQEHYYLAMEWAQGGDVYSFLRPGSPRRALFQNQGEWAIRFILASAVLSLEYLHARGIVYCDLKPENLLVFADGYVKLADFGLARQTNLEEGPSGSIRAGTRLYFSPEMVLEGKCSRAVDLWALGVIAYELANLFLPFRLEDIRDRKNFAKVVLEAEEHRVWVNQYVSATLKTFINGLLKLNPKARLGAGGWASVKAHPFFHQGGFDWDKLQQKSLESPLLSIIEEKVHYQRISREDVRPGYGREVKREERMETIEDWSS
jgi:serine/threonine protein kinase